MRLYFISLVRALDGIHKWKISLLDKETGLKHSIKFGAQGYSDYTMHHDKARRERYLLRHKLREDWDNPLAPGTLSRYILWNKPTVFSSLADYLRRFQIKH